VGLRDGQQIRLRGQGGEGRNGGPRGDVLLKKRRGDASFKKAAGAVCW